MEQKYLQIVEYKFSIYRMCAGVKMQTDRERNFVYVSDEEQSLRGQNSKRNIGDASYKGLRKSNQQVVNIAASNSHTNAAAIGSPNYRQFGNRTTDLDDRLHF